MCLRLLAFTSAILLFAALAACDSGDGGDKKNNGGGGDIAEGDTGGGGTGGGTFTTADACDAIFECIEDHWGYPDETQCETLYVEGCKSPAGLVSCAGDCYAKQGCSAFDKCEPACWESNCK